MAPFLSGFEKVQYPKLILHQADKSLIYTLFRLLQPINADPPIEVTLLPITTLSRLLQSRNAYTPIEVTASGIVTLSRELDAQIVCEGVETQKDVNLMKEIGAFVAQGFFYSRPIPEEEFEALLNVGNV